MSLFTLAFHHLWRRKISTLIALIGISVAVATAGILLRTEKLAQSRFSTLAHTGDAVIGAKSSDLSLLLGCLNLEGQYPGFIPSVLYQSLASHQSVTFEDGSQSKGSAIETIIPFVIFGKIKNFRVIGTDQVLLNSSRPTLPVLAEGRWPSEINEVMVGSRVAQDLGLSNNSIIRAETWVDREQIVDHELPLKVVGILKPTQKSWDRGIYSNLETAKKVFELYPQTNHTPWRENVLHYFLVYLQPQQMENLNSLVNQRTVAQTVSVDEGLRQLEELTGTQETMALFITLVIVFLGALSVCTMMITRFESMGQQLAILRAIGYSKWELTALLFWETALIGLCSCILGALLDGAFFPWIRQILGSTLPGPDIVTMDLWNSWPIWVVTFAASLIGLLIPMLRLYRQDIHQSLRNLS